MSPWLVALGFFVILFSILSLTRFAHLLNAIFEHRLKWASSTRGHKPLGDVATLDEDASSAQWQSLVPRSSMPRRTMVILGSGGHTAEMLCLLQHIDRRRCVPLIYVRAKTDISSEVRIRQMEVRAASAVNLADAVTSRLLCSSLSLSFSPCPPPLPTRSDRPRERPSL